MDKDNKLKFYYVKEFDIGKYLQENSEPDEYIQKMIKDAKAKLRKKRIDEMCEYVSQFLSKKEVDEIRKTAESVSDEKFEELMEKAEMLTDIISSGNFIK